MIKLVVRDKRFANLSSDGHEIPLNSGQVPSNYGHVFKKSSNTDSARSRKRTDDLDRQARMDKIIQARQRDLNLCVFVGYRGGG
jgi:hypothetical protein